MKNVTKILTAVVLCAAVFASTQRTDALGGNAAFWPGDEANIAAFPAQINNHGYLQVTNMSNVGGNAHVDLVFSNGGANWSFGFSDDADTWFDLGWGKDGMGLNIAMKASDNGSGTTTDGFMLSFGKDLGDMGEIGVHLTSGDNSGTDWAENGIGVDYRKSCGFWVFTDMVANLHMPSENETETDFVAASCTTGTDGAGGAWDGTEANCTDGYDAGTPESDDQDMTLDVDWFGHMDAGAADVMFAMGFEHHALTGTMAQTANVGVEAALTDNVTLRGGMEWMYVLAADDDATGAATGDNAYAWTTGAGVNFGSMSADLTLGTSFWSNPLGFIAGDDDDTAWGSITATYSF